MERRFGFDFGDVRIHTDRRAAELSRSFGAEAFTYGRHIFFGPGRFRPGAAAGGRLLAHELVHTRQQAAGGPRVQRTLSVAKPGDTTSPHTRTNGDLVVSLFDELCRDFKWKLSGSTVEPRSARSCKGKAVSAGSTPTACECACHFTQAGGPHADVEVNTAHNDTVRTATAPDTFRIRITGTAQTGIVGVRGTPPASGSPLQTLPDPPWLVLGHELCGHAKTTYPLNASSPATLDHQMSEQWDKTAVDIENVIRREHEAARGVSLGVRAGDFGDPDGDIHYGSLIQLPAATTPRDLLVALGLPVRYKLPRCVRHDFFYPCTKIPKGEAAMRRVKVINRITITDHGNQFVPWDCRSRRFAKGLHFNVEGVFWHRARAGDTKRSVAKLWRVRVSALDRANRPFNSIHKLGAADALTAGQAVVIPYNAAPGTDRYFLRRGTGPC